MGKKWKKSRANRSLKRVWTVFADISAMLIEMHMWRDCATDEHVLCHNHTTNDKSLPQCKFKFWTMFFSLSHSVPFTYVCVCAVSFIRDICVLFSACNLIACVIWMWIISFCVPRCWRPILCSAVANFMINIYFSWNELWFLVKLVHTPPEIRY